jgi:hypothetical protein
LGRLAFTPLCDTMTKFFANASLASFVAVQSISFFAASIFFVVFMIPEASMSQPSPSFGKMSSTGAPFAFTSLPRKSNEMPTTNSPAPAWRQGFEPECVYCAMFSCRASMNFQALASPMVCSQPETSRKPVPLEAGLGIVTWPL